jgi:hypothetical protein
MVLRLDPITGQLVDDADANTQLLASLAPVATPNPNMPIVMPPPGGQKRIAAVKPPLDGGTISTGLEPPVAPVTPPAAPMPATIPITRAQETTTETTTGGKDTSVLNPGIAAKKKAIGAQSNVTAKEREAQSEAAADIKKLNTTFQEQQKELTADKDLNLYAAQQEKDALAQDVGKYQYDQNRFYKNMSTGQQVLAGLGVALSALGSGFTGKQNQALEIINQGVERDLKQQSMEYDKLKDKAAYANTAYGQLRQIYGDKEEADRKFYELSKQNILQKADAKIATMYPEKTEAEKQGLLAEMSLRLGETKLNAQGTKSTTKGSVTNKEDKVTGFGTNKDRLDAVDQASKNPDIAKFKEIQAGYNYLKDKKTLTPFELGNVIAGKEFMNQGSYSERMAEELANKGYPQQVVSFFRKQVGKSTPIPGSIVDDIRNYQAGKLQAAAGPAYETGKNYVAAGIDPRSIWGVDDPRVFVAGGGSGNKGPKGNQVVKR